MNTTGFLCGIYMGFCMKVGKIIRVFLLAVTIILICIMIVQCFYKNSNKPDGTEKIEEIRNFKIDNEILCKVIQYCEGQELSAEEYFSALFIKNKYQLKNSDIKKVDINNYANNHSEEFELIKVLCKPVLYDVKVFPVPANGDSSGYVYYDDSWNVKRTYGGDRRHEGCDIMAKINERGRYPIISMTDGIVENIGWLELGGYRIGIRSENGGYFYYAHLYDYAPNLKEGDTVYAGQYIGTMGDSGYSKVEGTVGNFDVHLHVSIYVTYNNVEYSINPYYILKNLKVTQAKY